MVCTQHQEKVIAATPREKSRMRASLRLAFARDDATGQTTIAFSHQDPPLRVVRAFHPENGSAMAHLHNVSGGLFGGDDLTLHVEVSEGAEAQLTTTGATRVYRRGLGTAITRQNSEFTVAEDALLEYVPDAIIPFAGANYYQHTTVRLSSNAGLFWWELLAPGREARNEVFAFERVEMRTEVRTDSEIVSIDRMKLEPLKNSVASPGRMGSLPILRYISCVQGRRRRRCLAELGAAFAKNRCGLASTRRNALGYQHPEGARADDSVSGETRMRCRFWIVLPVGCGQVCLVWSSRGSSTENVLSAQAECVLPSGR